MLSQSFGLPKLKSTRFNLVIFAFLLLLSACNFDGQRQYDHQYPATLTVLNSGNQTFDVESIYNTNKTDAGFILNGFSLEPQEQKSMRVSYDVLSALKDKAVEFAGQCSDGETWLLHGENLSYSTPSEAKIVFSIKACNTSP